jgi:hypothetical protein
VTLWGRRPPRLACALVAGLLLAGPSRAVAQDTVIVIDPDAPPVQLRSLAGPPRAVVEEAVGRHNDTTVTRFYGSFTVASGTWVRGDVAVYRGTLRVAGRITGRVTIINGNLVVGPLGTIEGDVLVLGGRLEVAPSGRLAGSARSYADPAPVFRTTTGALEVREQPLALGELAAARASFQAGRIKTTLSLETGRSYNRVEGLPILAGPTFSFPTPNLGEVRIELWGLGRTEKDRSGRLGAFGFRTRAEWESKASGVRGGIGARWESLVEPIEDVQLTRGETGWASFLFHRDYDDYYEARGVEGYAFVYPYPTLRLQGSVRFDNERTVPASDPITLFRSGSAWRPNPLVDDGHYTTVGVRAELDTRNSRFTPTSGYLASAWFERSASTDVAPIALPTEVRPPLPTFRTYAFNRVGFDLRGYGRINQASRVNLRVLGRGWLGGDPLPVQRRVSVGGPGILPGLPFRAQNCAPASLPDPAGTALCDRFLAVQAELRVRFPLALRDVFGAQEWLLLDRLFGGDPVLFADGGKAWLTGDGPGRVPNDRIPILGEWDYDVGLGIDLGGLAVYLAKSLSTAEGPRITLRLQRRF